MKNNQLCLDYYKIDDYFAIPKKVSKFFYNPVKSYSHIDDIEIVEMTYPNGFLETKYGLKNVNIPSDIVFEYVNFANQLDIMKPSIGNGFTVKSKEKGKKLAEYIIEKLF